MFFQEVQSDQLVDTAIITAKNSLAISASHLVNLATLIVEFRHLYLEPTLSLRVNVIQSLLASPLHGPLAPLLKSGNYNYASITIVESGVS